jgi:hypothetical protein
MFEDEIRKASTEIWTLCKPFLKDKPLSDKEWDELIKASESVKYERPTGCDFETMRKESGLWKPIDYFKANFLLDMLKTIESYQRGLNDG